MERITSTVAKTTFSFLKNPDESQMLMNVALGQDKADLAVVNARIANVYTAEFIDNCAISIKGKWIAYVGPNPDDMIGPKTEVIDAGGQTVIPGLIDGHTHLAAWCKVDEFLKHAAKGGTTTIVTETLEVFLVAGYEGLVDLLESFEDQPVKIWSTAPSTISISKSARGISKENLQKLLQRDDVIGLGESYWQSAILDPDYRVLSLIREALASGKTVQGHAAGAYDRRLAAYAAAIEAATGKPVIECLIHMPLVGVMVSVERDL